MKAQAGDFLASPLRGAIFKRRPRECQEVGKAFTAVVEKSGVWFIAYCPEVPGANGQGKSKAGALKSLSSAISLIFEERRKEGLRGIPPDAVVEKVVVK